MQASIGQLTLGEGDARAARHLKRYAVAVTLGSGASGTVKLANSEDLDAMVAIKVVNTKALDPRGIDMQRVRNEIQGWCFRPNVIFMECVCVCWCGCCPFSRMVRTPVSLVISVVLLLGRNLWWLCVCVNLVLFKRKLF